MNNWMLCDALIWVKFCNGLVSVTLSPKDSQGCALCLQPWERITKNRQYDSTRKTIPRCLSLGMNRFVFVINAKVCRSVITTNLANCSYIRGMRWLFLFLALAMGTVVSAQDFDDAVSPEAQAAAAMRSKRYREAENIYRSLLQRNPESMTNKHLLSHALLLQQRFSESDSLLRVAYFQDSTHPGTYWYFGISAERQDQYDRAYGFFRRYIQKSEQKRLQEFNQSAWLHAGSALRRKMHGQGISVNEWADMVYCYESYMQAQPADPLVTQLKEFVDAVRLRQPRGGEKLVWSEQ